MIFDDEQIRIDVKEMFVEHQIEIQKMASRVLGKHEYYQPQGRIYGRMMMESLASRSARKKEISKK
jgi:hypothetical protein